MNVRVNPDVSIAASQCPEILELSGNPLLIAYHQLYDLSINIFRTGMPYTRLQVGAL